MLLKGVDFHVKEMWIFILAAALSRYVEDNKRGLECKEYHNLATGDSLQRWPLVAHYPAKHYIRKEL